MFGRRQVNRLFDTAVGLVDEVLLSDSEELPSPGPPGGIIVLLLLLVLVAVVPRKVFGTL